MRWWQGKRRKKGKKYKNGFARVQEVPKKPNTAGNEEGMNQLAEVRT